MRTAVIEFGKFIQALPDPLARGLYATAPGTVNERKGDVAPA